MSGPKKTTGIKLKSLKIGDLVAPLPIVQGGMGVGISLSSLSSAVANEGGVGVISTAGIGMDREDFDTNFRQANMVALRDEIRKARRLSDGILGVNIMVALSNYDDMVRVAVEEGVDVIFSGAGLALDLPRYSQPKGRTKLVPIVSSGRAAGIISRAWERRFGRVPDAVVVEGPLAGGHLGFSAAQLGEIDKYPLDKLVLDVKQALEPYEIKHEQRIPVIGAGGLFDGRDIARLLEAGADGVQLGTRFVCTEECDASSGFKESYLKARKEDIVYIQSPVGMPGRAIRNGFLDAVERGERQPIECTYQCLKTCVPSDSPYCIARALTNAKKGDFEYGFAFAGANAYRLERIVSVRELMSSLVAEAEGTRGSDAPVGLDMPR